MTDHHMTPDAFRRWGHAAVDRIARYFEEVEEYPVLSQVAPGEIRSRLPERAPERGESFDRILADLDEIVLPGITHWQSPSFFAYFPSNTSGPSILGELLSAGLGIQGMLWATSPAATELETHVLDWLVDMLGLPATFSSRGEGGGVIQDTASSAVLCALVAARERATGFESNRRGLDRPLAAYASTEAHSSLEKAMGIAGIGRERLRLVPVDDRLALDPVALAAMVAADRREGLEPFFVMATVGTTSTNALDPLGPIGEVCRREELWLHVDAAMCGTAALCPELRFIQKGVELADSYCFNPHKWMFTNFDCTCFWVADRQALVESLSILPEYLRNRPSATGEVIDYRDWHVPLGRRFRALKLWFVIRHYGVEGLRAHVRRHVELAAELVARIEADPRFELAAPVPLNLVCFRHRAGEEVTRAILEGVNGSGKAYLTHTRVRGEYTIRVSVGQARTEARHVDALWGLIEDLAPE